MSRLYGRAPHGKRVVGRISQNYRANITMLTSLGLQGLETLMTIDEATDGEVFTVYVTIGASWLQTELG